MTTLTAHLEVESASVKRVFQRLKKLGLVSSFSDRSKSFGTLISSIPISDKITLLRLAKCRTNPLKFIPAASTTNCWLGLRGEPFNNMRIVQPPQTHSHFQYLSFPLYRIHRSNYISGVLEDDARTADLIDHGICFAIRQLLITDPGIRFLVKADSNTSGIEGSGRVVEC